MNIDRDEVVNLWIDRLDGTRPLDKDVHFAASAAPIPGQGSSQHKCAHCGVPVTPVLSHSKDNPDRSAAIPAQRINTMYMYSVNIHVLHM